MEMKGYLIFAIGIALLIFGSGIDQFLK